MVAGEGALPDNFFESVRSYVHSGELFEADGEIVEQKSCPSGLLKYPGTADQWVGHSEVSVRLVGLCSDFTSTPRAWELERCKEGFV